MPESGQDPPPPPKTTPPKTTPPKTTTAAASASVGRDLMEFDLELGGGGDSWPFDPSSPFQSLLQFSFPPPPSPLWFYEHRGNEISGAAADCSRFFDSISVQESGNIDTENGKLRQFQFSEVEENSDTSFVIKERMSQALRYFKEWTDQHVLVQVWAPVKDGDRYVLTTSGQPFVLDPQSTGLLKYRTVSLMYMFSIDEDSDADLGLPGRVFKQKLPEWTPNVQYYSSKEYPRLNHALNHNVRGTLALPVFEPSGQSCVGVVELIMTSQKINYAYEFGKVCKALEAVNLKSSEILDHPNIQICNEGRQAALAEILEILTVVCETHKLPLGQTWVPCKHWSVLADGGGSKKSCSSFDGSCMGQVCMSTTDVAFYVVDAHMWGFRDACVEHHLQKGQGVAGRTFESQRPCFSRDVTRFCKTEYPLVHYARMFGLAGCLAICLQSTESGSDDYILEFFLPLDCKDTNEQHALLDSILTLMKQCLRSLKVIAGLELEKSLSLEIIDMIADGDYELKSKHCEPNLCTSPKTITPEGLDGSQKQHLVPDIDAEKNENINLDSNILGIKNTKISVRRRGKAEKSISLEVLQQHFTGSLKNAAKSLGVCPTTMKRICRQHGISRWPSRKINKVNRSLSKLRRVMESVQGAEGAFNLTSLASPHPVAGGSNSFPLNLDATQSKGAVVAVGDENLLPTKAPESDNHLNKLTADKELINGQNSFQPEPSKESHCSKPRSSSEGSMGTPTSLGSCQESPVNETHLGKPISSSGLNQEETIRDSLGFASQPAGDPNMTVMFSMADAIIMEPQPVLGGMLAEDCGSSKDLGNLCYSACNPLQANPMQEARTVTIKARYKDDIIRFRFPCNAGVVFLNEEVAKRLKLEVGTFHIKYLDDDHEWVMLACDADLEECVEISRVSGGQVIRLSVHDILAYLGSSCESSGE